MESMTNAEGLTLTLTVVWLLSLMLCTQTTWSYTLNRRVSVYSVWTWLWGTMTLIMWIIAPVGLW